MGIRDWSSGGFDAIGIEEKAPNINLVLYTG